MTSSRLAHVPRRSPARHVLVAILSSCLPVLAQGAWVEREVPTPRQMPGTVYDGNHGRVILFGGMDYNGLNAFDDTWAYDGVHWRRLGTASSPTARGGFGIACDTARDRIVVFGGTDVNGSYTGDTWEFDGGNWLQVTTVHQPPERAFAAMAYDPVRGETVLFGGVDVNGSPLDDRWVYDGVDWTAASGPAANRPPARAATAMVYDAARARMVLFGGQDLNGALGDTWEHDGFVWSSTTATAAPRSYFGMAYDSSRQRVVRFSGDSSDTTTWEYDGVAWIQRVGVGAPPGSELPGLAYDVSRSRCVLIGGSTRGDTWEYDGLAWTANATATSPGARVGGLMEFDSAHGVSVYCGGQDGFGTATDVWHYDGRSWTRQLAPFPLAAGVWDAAMAFDSARGRIVVFSGSGGTWEYDTASWNHVITPTSPPVLADHQMVYDLGRNRVVLFGGRTVGPTGATLAETWEYDGVDWTLASTAVSPPVRQNHGMVYDATRGRVVVFGGRPDLASPQLTDTWEYDGGNWTQVPTAHAPNFSWATKLVHDLVGGQVLAFGGADWHGIVTDETWSYDGTDWTPLTVAGPGARYFHTMCFDWQRGHAVVFGGMYQNGLVYGDTWEFHPSTAAAAFSVYGTGCVGSNGVPTTGAVGLPRIGDWFTMTLANARPSSLAVFVFGASDAQWATLPLPLPLAGVGAPGCTLFTSVDLTGYTLTTSGGDASATMYVPNTQFLVGIPFYHQFAVLDPVNALGLVLSNAGHSVIGDL